MLIIDSLLRVTFNKQRLSGAVHYLFERYISELPTRSRQNEDY